MQLNEREQTRWLSMAKKEDLGFLDVETDAKYGCYLLLQQPTKP